MEQKNPMSLPKIRHKSFTYETDLNWQGGRTAILGSPGKPEFRVTSPPEFKGEEGTWTPEELFVAAIDICTMTTFMAFAQHQNLPVISYESHAAGFLEFVDGKYQFTKVVLKPSIKVGAEAAVDQAEKMVADAHRSCLVANSVRASVAVEPVIAVVEDGDIGMV